MIIIVAAVVLFLPAVPAAGQPGGGGNRWLPAAELAGASVAAVAAWKWRGRENDRIDFCLTYASHPEACDSRTGRSRAAEIALWSAAAVLSGDGARRLLTIAPTPGGAAVRATIRWR